MQGKINNKRRYKMRAVILVVVLALALLLIPPMLVKSDNLYKFVTDKRSVNIAVNKFEVAESCKDINGSKLAEIFKEALLNRKSVDFNIVKNEKDADLVVSGKVEKFVYSEDDPIDVLIPIGLVIDLATSQNYARMEFNINVYNPVKNKIVWKKRLKATLNKSNMPRDESLFLIMERAGKIFIRKCFGKLRK